MKDIEFNLLDEPWIRVMKADCSVTEVSLTDALLHSHEYEDLAGELPTQDIAVMRVLLAVLHTVFERVDADGHPEPLEAENALDRWEELWNLKAFPERPIRDYLDHWHDRFWLFHPERPFFQVPELEIGTSYSSSKLNGEISESNNKVRLFSVRTGNRKKFLSYAEAARWLINLNAFDDNSGKPVPSGSNLPSCGAGWLGRLGLIIAQGHTLFETLMLNLIFDNTGIKNWHTGIPEWEKTFSKTAQRTEIAMPQNPIELYTIQSRRIILFRNDNVVTGFRLLGGDFFPNEKAYPYEPMTLWRPIIDKKRNVVGIQPCRHDKTKQVWRNFSSIAEENNSSKRPGIVNWIRSLVLDEQIISNNDIIRFKTAAVEYVDQDYSVKDVFDDFLSFQAGLLTDSGKQWQEKIKMEISYIDEIAVLIWKLKKDLLSAEGSENAEQANRAKEQFYFRLDESFRKWLEKLSPEQRPEEILELRSDWHKQAIYIAKQLGKKLIDESGLQSFTGRTITDKKNNQHFISAPMAYNLFISRLNHIYDSKGA